MNGLLAALLLGIWTTGPQNTLKFHDPGGVDTVTYPASAFSVEEIKAIMRFSPKLRMGSSYPVFNPLDLCVKGDPRYQGCGTEAAQDQWFAANAKVNLAEMKKALDDLERMPKVKGLEQIIDYERDFQRFYVDISNTILQFFLTGDTSLLEVPVDAINPIIECSDALLEVKNAKSKTEAVKIAKFDWYTCVNHAEHKKVGSYPASQWSLFLEETGITEKYNPNDDD